MLVVFGLSLTAQAPSANATQAVYANLNQLMRGVLYPAANVVFSAQSDNPGDVKPIPGHDPSMATDPLTSTFGGWLAVENAAVGDCLDRVRRHPRAYDLQRLSGVLRSRNLRWQPEQAVLSVSDSSMILSWSFAWAAR